MRKYAAIVSMLCLFAPSRGLAAEDTNNCNAAMSDASSSNAYDLWRGASSCGEAGDMVRASFLLLAGQIRGLTDMAMLDPATDEDQGKAGELYGVLYYQAGGSGDEDILRDADQTVNLFRELRNWRPALDQSYDPGWSYKNNVDVELYGNMIACQRELRIAKLNRYAGLVRNDDYYDAQKELRAFQAENPGPVTVGTEEHEEMQGIMAKMSAQSPTTPMPSQQPPECDFAMQFKPDPEANFTQVYVGANGPGGSGAGIFSSSDEILSSWISHALSVGQLGQLLSEVDFDHQIIVSLTFGKRRNATGTIYLSDVDYSSARESLMVSGLIGVTVPDCEIPYAESYPFVLGAAPRPEVVPKSHSMSLQNFADGCKPIMNGSQTVMPE